MMYDPRWADAISAIESGGNYGELGPITNRGDRAYGKYQVMGSNVPEWTQSALGYAMSPQDFLRDKAAQDAVFKNRFGGYANKYGNPQDAASAWFTGRPLSQGANASDVLGTTGAHYVDMFNKHLGNTKVASADPTDTGALSTAAQLGPGILGNPPQSTNPLGILPGDWGNRLQGAGAALASIGSPSQGMALAAMLRQQGANAGSFSVHVDPKTGKGVRVNSKTGAVEPFTAFTPTGQDLTEYQKKYDDENAKKYGDYDSKITADASTASQQLGSLTALKQALSDPNLYQGAGGDRVQDLKKMANAFLPEGAQFAGTTNGDVARSIINQMTLSLRNFSGGMPGSLSDKDLAFLKQMGANLDNTPEANARVIDMMTKVHQRTLDVAHMRDEYADAHGGRIDRGFSKTLRQYSEANPLFGGDNNQQAAPAAAPANRKPLSDIFK